MLRVSEHTLKAMEKAESHSIAERRERLLAGVWRLASKAIDRVEGQIDDANITQATVAFGVATEKPYCSQAKLVEARHCRSICTWVWLSYSTSVTRN